MNQSCFFNEAAFRDWTCIWFIVKFS